MQSRAIPDARITASSMWDGNHAPAQGRLNYKPPRGHSGSWSSKHNRVGQWIQVDLNRVTKVTGIATQGRTNANQWVTKYKLQYSLDGKTFNNYEGGKVFTANKDRNSVVKHDLHNPIIARRRRTYELYNKMKLYMIAGLLAVLVVSGLSMDAIPGHEIRAILKLANRVSREHGIPALLKLPNDVSGEAKRGSGDILHHLYCLEFHKAGYCKYALIKNKYCKKTCFLCNIEPLGMQSRAIPDARITASSMWDGNHAPSQGRLYYKPPGGKAGSWSSRRNAVGQWIKVDLNRVTKVTGIATQGRTNANQWVTKYKLQYSLDGKSFNNYKGGKVFAANRDRNSVVKHNIQTPIIARRRRTYELYSKMKLYMIAGLLAVLVVPGLSMDAIPGHEIRAILKLANRVSREHGIPALLKLPNDVSGEAKRGSGDILHHLYCLEFHKAGYCKYALIKNKYCKKTCFLCNIEALGMQSRAIPNARITASSMWDGNHAPSQGRLYYKPPGGKAGSWSSRHNRVGQWIKVDLNRVTKVTGIATQGRTNANQWVTKYKLQYSLDGKSFNNYEGGKVFAANRDRNSVVKHDIQTPIIARRRRTYELYSKMKLYLIAGLLAVLVVSGLSTDATQGPEIRAILKLANRVSREHGIPALLKLPNDVSGEAKRGSGDILHHLYCLEFHKAGYCKYALIKNKYCKKTCFLCNIEALGMQSRAIPNARITASSMWDGNHAPSQGRLYYKPPGGKAGSWSSRHNRVGQWIKVDLNRVTKVTGIATQGRTECKPMGNEI
ncbi:hypothetical protein QZH41_006205 [Actinostola sp. cb2023]|nr:hypothetical protein QZH41_006205 [Actinostola sp. cb2023]